MATWQLIAPGVNDTFANLSLGKLKRARYSQRADLVTFEAPVTSFLSDSIIAYGDTVSINKDRAQWFYGRCISIPRQGSGTSESITYQVAGPWWHLENIVYQQYWALHTGGSLVATYKSRVVLGQNTSGTAVTTGAQLTDVINYAIAMGAPITLGTIEPAMYVPYEEQTDMSCAEALVALLRWHPDCVAWFDYSTAKPTLHITAKATMTPTTIDAIAGSPVQSIAITPRYDLQIPGVKIMFEKTIQIDDVVYDSLTTQSAGDPTQIGSLISTIRLGGSVATYINQAIATGSYPTSMTDTTWWKSMVPSLQAYADADIAISNVVRDGDGYPDGIHEGDPFPRYLLPSTGGEIQDWMADQGIWYEEETITADLALTVRDGNDNVCTVHSEKPLVLILVSTNATTRTYQTQGSYEAGESAPSGMATAIYNAWAQLQHDGQIVLQESECCGTYFPGRSLNITNGVTAWETMVAMIVGVDEDIDAGLTSITIGPCQWLGAGDILTLFQRVRTRKPSTSYPGRTTGESTDTYGAVTLKGARSVPISPNGDGQFQRIATRINDNNAKVIDINPADITGAADRTIKARLFSVCEDGVVKSVWILSSETFT
jgi:hypothetical protein